MRFQTLAWFAPMAGVAAISFFVADPLAAQQNEVGRAPSPSVQAPEAQPEPFDRPAWRGGNERDDVKGQRPGWRGAQDDDDDEDDHDDRSDLRRDESPSWQRNGSSWRDRDSGPSMRPPMGMGPFCGALGARFASARLARMERAIQPTEAQRGALEKLREAMALAQDRISASCTEERPLTPTGRLAALEKRLEASLDAVKTVRPALDALYASLSDEQKARLQMMAPYRSWRDHSFRQRDDAAMEERGRDQRDAQNPDGDRRGEGWNRRGDAERRWDDDAGRRSWQRTPERDRDGYTRAPMRRDYDRDGWPDHWRGPS